MYTRLEAYIDLFTELEHIEIPEQVCGRLSHIRAGIGSIVLLEEYAMKLHRNIVVLG